ncbi:hypothetical protein L7F22_059883 [Adiantum nelumboides]|nr:hypothetical protein [Adiantum nelumboides]
MTWQKTTNFEALGKLGGILFDKISLQSIVICGSRLLRLLPTAVCVMTAAIASCYGGRSLFSLSTAHSRGGAGSTFPSHRRKPSSQVPSFCISCVLSHKDPASQESSVPIDNDRIANSNNSPTGSLKPSAGPHKASPSKVKDSPKLGLVPLFFQNLAGNKAPREKGDIRDVILMSLSFAVYVYISQRLVCAYCMWQAMTRHF